MLLTSETQVLDKGFRSQVLEEINGTENTRRKNEAFKAYESFKDHTDTHVMNLLLAQFDTSTVNEMQYAITNISFLRKVVDKLARVYSNGVKRTLPKVKDTKTIEDVALHLCMNSKMKKVNKYLRLFKNTMAYAKPYPCDGKFDIDVQILAPFLYDVIESPEHEEEPLVVILSDFSPTNTTLSIMNTNQSSRSPTRGVSAYQTNYGDGKDQIIADSPVDKGADKNSRKYIWWSPNFHFVTDAKGNIISEGDGSNPIGALPFVNFAQDQDGSFWAIGGSDLVESSIKINALMTHITHIAVSQGYGQLTMTGKNLPKSVKVGPNHCIQVEYQEGEPVPHVQFLTANPPVGELMGLVEMYVALLLSTNNLSTSGFSSSLKGSQGFSSGVALLIDKSESVEEIEEQAQIFKDNEPELWEIIQKWQFLYKQRNLLVDDLQSVTLPLDMDMTISFPPAMPVMSESDQLDIIAKRRELALNTEIELLMLDDSSLTEETAKAKALKILEEKMGRVQSIIQPSNHNPVDGPPVDNPTPDTNPLPSNNTVPVGKGN